MRFILVLVAALVLAGCAQPAAPFTPPSGEANATSKEGAPVVPITDAPVLVEETFFVQFMPGYKLESAFESFAASEEPERIAPTALYSGQVMPEPFAPWLGEASAFSYEFLDEAEWTIHFKASQSAVSTVPEQLGLSPVGGWFGSADRDSEIAFVAGAPAQLEADKQYSLKHTFKMPPGGYFLPAGDAFAMHVFLGYQTADHTPVKWVLGGDDPTRVVMKTRQIELPATTAVEVLSEKGTMSPHPGYETSGNPDAKDFPVTLPDGTVYAIFEVVGTSAGPANFDVDLAVNSASGVAGKGNGPTAHEIVKLGPGNIAAMGNAYTLHVGASGTLGGSYTIKATAFVAAQA